MKGHVDSNMRPALLGGTPVRPEGPLAWPMADPDILEALQSAYREGSWGQYRGVHVERLEQRLAEYHQTPFVQTCGSGTFAVELALRALKVGPGDEVILAAYDYPGNFLSVHAVGAVPVLVDVTANNWNLDPVKVEEALSPATRAIIVSHLHGGVVPMQEVMEAARGANAAVIEDAAQMAGAVIEGRKAGTWGDVGILSFGGSKLLSAGRGGALLTPLAEVCQRARVYQHRGNILCPLSELQAAVLLPQLEKLDTRNARRSEGARQVCADLKRFPGLEPFLNPCASEPGYYKLGFQFDGSRFGLPRDRFVAACRAEGIAFDEGFRALHMGRSPSRFRQVGTLTEAERAHAGTVVLHHPVLLGSPEDLEQVRLAVGKIALHAEELRNLG